MGYYVTSMFKNGSIRSVPGYTCFLFSLFSIIMTITTLYPRSQHGYASHLVLYRLLDNIRTYQDRLFPFLFLVCGRSSISFWNRGFYWRELVIGSFTVSTTCGNRDCGSRKKKPCSEVSFPDTPSCSRWWGDKRCTRDDCKDDDDTCEDSNPPGCGYVYTARDP